MDGVYVESDGIMPIKRGLLLLLLLSAVAFLLLSFAPGARQKEIFPYDELCDYRMFVLPCMTSASPYSAPSVALRDACYPPIAYCAVKALATDRGHQWSLSGGEVRLVLSLLVMQCIGAVMLVRKIPQRRWRFIAAAAILLSPACICTLLRGNPVGWAFALVCLFLCWYRSENFVKRIAAAVALGAATALKLSPCLFGCLYLSKGLFSAGWIPWKEVLVAACSAVLLIFLPFLAFGGIESILPWMSNADANATFYSVDNPLWGVAALANHLIDSKEVALPCIGRFAWATRALAAVLIILGVSVRNDYRRLLYVGAAMAYVTHHDYGGVYLLPAFVVWLRESGDSRGRFGGVLLLLETVAWFFILTPFQIPNPCISGSLNAMLQNEFLFVLLAVSFVPLSVDKGCRE